MMITEKQSMKNDIFLILILIGIKCKGKTKQIIYVLNSKHNDQKEADKNFRKTSKKQD